MQDLLGNWEELIEARDKRGAKTSTQHEILMGYRQRTKKQDSSKIRNMGISFMVPTFRFVITERCFAKDPIKRR